MVAKPRQDGRTTDSKKIFSRGLYTENGLVYNDDIINHGNEKRKGETKMRNFGIEMEMHNITAMIYVMTSPKRPLGAPSKNYFHTIMIHDAGK